MFTLKKKKDFSSFSIQIVHLKKAVELISQNLIVTMNLKRKFQAEIHGGKFEDFQYCIKKWQIIYLFSIMTMKLVVTNY